MTMQANGALGYDGSGGHNAAMVKQVILGDAMGYLMNGGDTQTRRFAATVLDAGLDFTNKEVTYSRQIDYVHRAFQEEVKSNLLEPMSDAEVAEYLMRETLGANNEQETISLLGSGNRIEEITLQV